MEAPTLMIGLGGIGSRIVDSVYGWIPPERRGHIAVHAFDTNVNDIGRLANLRGRVTQTSERWSVGQYLHRADPLVREWFPHEQPELQRKLLTEGAGQIRAVSRLAYRAAMETGHLHPLERQIASIFQARGEGRISSVRVMIVSSLAGGTGAGIFLQTAMYLRELFERTFDRQNVLVRGAFLLPDVLVVPRVIDETEWENVRANAYASLKELNAITQNASGAAGPQRVTIEMEYRPGQTDASGRQSLAITARQLPYDFVFLYDFENTRGENLGHLRPYLEQVAQTVYLQLFTPIAEGHFSQEDNRILNLIGSQGRSRYCGAGVARLIYPYEEIAEYAALRWSTDSLSNQWLKLDEEFEAEYRQYERDQQAGVNRPEPRLAERYVWLLDNHASGDQPQPFFQEVFRSTRILDEKGRPTEAKAKLFLDAIEQEIERVLREDRSLAQAEADCRVDEGRLKDRNRVQHEVIRVEDALLTLQEMVLRVVSEFRTFLFNQIVLQDCDAPGGKQGQDYRLNTWLLGKPEPLHPVGVRYVLYQLFLMLEQRTRELGSRNTDMLESIRRYAQTFDLPDTEEFVETAEDRVRQAINQRFYQALLRNEFKEFQGEYLEKSQRQFRNLVRYKKDRLMELVLSALMVAIDEMLQEWERYFRNLRMTRNHLLEEMNRRATEHENGADPTRQFVLGTRAHKERLWESVRIGLAGRAMPIEISEQIYLGHYRRFCEKRHGSRVTEQRPEKTEEVFRQDVVAWCRNTIGNQDALNLNVVRALQLESEFADEESAGARITQRIEQLTHLARPWVPDVPNAAEIHFWGVHPDSLRELPAAQRENLFGSQAIGDEAFPPYEIIRYRAHYGLQVENFPKFSSGALDIGVRAGEYFRAYARRIERLNDGTTVTPHLDKRWHLQAYMPDLNVRKVEEDEQKVKQALLRGLIYRYLRVVDWDRRRVWDFVREGTPTPVITDGEPTPDRLYLLHEALRHNPSIVDRTIERAAEEKQQDLGQLPDQLEQHRFYAGCVETEALGKPMNILDVVLRYSEGGAADTTVTQQRDELLVLLLDEINAYFRDAYGSGRAHTADTHAAAFIERLASEAEIYQKADRGSREYVSWSNTLEGRVRTLQRS